MMTKSVVCNRVVEKRQKWSIFEELSDRNENLDEAFYILDELKEMIAELPDKLTCSMHQPNALVESVMTLVISLDKFLESSRVHFDEIEMKLEEMQRSLIHDETSNLHNFNTLTSEIRCSQKLIDALIGNAEEEIYRFLESEGLYGEKRKTDIEITELVLNF